MLEIRDVRLALDAKAALAECPLWSVSEQKLYWVDISGRALRLFQTGNLQTYAFLFAIGVALVLFFVLK